MNSVCSNLSIPMRKSSDQPERAEPGQNTTPIDHTAFSDQPPNDMDGALVEEHPVLNKTREEVNNISTTDKTLYPRCEFYHRDEKTSLFANDIKRAHTYTRSDGARYTQKKLSEVKFVPTPLTDRSKSNANSLSAHTGGFANPYVLPAYSNTIVPKTHQVQSGYSIDPTLYDDLLTYKLGLCQHVADTFKEKKLEGKRPYADLGSGEYRVKTVSHIPARGDFEHYEILICQGKGKNTSVSFYWVIADKVEKISLQDNEKLYNALLNSKDRVKTLKEFQPYLESKGIHPNPGMQGVYCSNGYPCVLVRFTPRTSDKIEKPSDTFFETYNHLLMAYFVAIVNCEAYRAGLPIEMVGRSGFGHNNPSIAVTGDSFRINIGLVPKAYADIIVKSLIKLHDLFYMLENSAKPHLAMDETLRRKLDDGRQVGFDEPLRKTYWESLWVKGSHSTAGHSVLYELIQRKIYGLELLTNFVLKNIDNPQFFTDPAIAEVPLKNMFDLINYVPDGNKSAKFMNPYIYLQKETEEFFLNRGITQTGIYKTKGKGKYFQAIHADLTSYKKRLELKIQHSELKNYIVNDEIAHSDCEKIFTNYINPVPQKMRVSSKEKFSTYLPSHKFDVLSAEIAGDRTVDDSQDEKWIAIINKLCSGLSATLPTDIKIQELYKFLEKSHIKFIRAEQTIITSTPRGNVNNSNGDTKTDQPDWGSSSETEESEFGATKKSIHAKKVIVANGMLAINLSYYAARLAIKNKMEGDKPLTVNLSNTYYETESCLKAATNPPEIEKKDKNVDILLFDLNSFNSDFIAKKVDLSKELVTTKPKVVILDHTSSTTKQIRNAIKIVYRICPDVLMVLLVTSGLKNEQGGADNNPYGKLTLLSLIDKSEGKEKTLTNLIYDEIKALTTREADGLDIKALLPSTAHDIRRLYKSRGFATTTSSILHGDSSSESSGNDELTEKDVH